MRKIVSTLILTILTVSLMAQCNLSGTVTDENNQPLPGANIYFPETQRGAVTDQSGRFQLKKLPCGKQLITISFLGYKTAIKNIILTKGNNQLAVQLKPVAIQGEEVVVSGNFTGSQHVNTVEISTLKSKNLLQKASPSFLDALTSLPGVDLISKGPGIGTPVIRGLSTNNILLLNNGIPMQNFQFSENHPYIVDDAGLGHIEVLKGPASLLYGSGAVGGIINLIPEPPLPDGEIKGNVLMKYFSNTQGIKSVMSLRGTQHKWVWGIYGNINSNKDYHDGAGDQIKNSRFLTRSFKANIGLLKKIGTFRLFSEYSNYHLGLTVPPSINLVKDNKRSPTCWYQDLNNLLIHSQNKLFIGKYKTSIDLAWQQNRRKLHTDQTKPVFTTVDMLLKTLNYSTKTTFPINNLTISTGIQGFWQNNKNFDAPDHVIPDATINEVSFYALLKYQKNKLNIENGLRYSHHTVDVPIQSNQNPGNPSFPLNKKFDNFSFSSGVTYQLSNTLLIRANLASAFRTPNLAELTQNGIHGTRYEVGDPNLKSQQNLEIDLGVHLHTIHTTFDLSGFYNTIQNYIYLSPTNDTTSSGLPVYRYTQENAFLYGGEAQLHIHPHPWHWLHFLSTWQYTVGRKKNKQEYLPFIPAQKIKMEVKFEKKKWKKFKNSFLLFGTNFVFKQDKVSYFEKPTAGYTLINLAMGTTVYIGKQEISLIFSGNNLSNKIYQDHLSTLKPLNINNMGRNISVSLKIPLDFR